MNNLATSPQAYYACHGVMTDPGMWAHLLDGLPTGIPELCRVVQGLLLHPFETRLYDVELTGIQRKEVNIRPVREMLKLIHSLDDRPLAKPRPPGERVVGNCRDHATLFCALLRHQGVPARVRVGFASYFGPRLNYDHWVTEYWNVAQERWVMVDPQIDDTQRQANKIEIDTCDMTPEQFYTASRAWNLCRSGQAKSGSFGHNSKLRGWPYLRTSLLQELAALNKVEVLPWDVWWELGRKSEETLTPEEKILLDSIAGLTTAVDERFAELRAAYNDDPQFVMPVQSKLKLLGLVDGITTRTGLVLRPPASSRLLGDRGNEKERPAQRVGSPSPTPYPLSLPPLTLLRSPSVAPSSTT